MTQVPPLLLFATFCSLALFVFAFTNILSTSEVPSICASVFLGAIPLLFIKDLYDKELERHKTLLLKRETYESSISSITSLLNDCLAFCSIQLRGGDREPFKCEENFNDYMESIEGCSPHFPPDCNITRLTTELTKKYASLETSMSRTRFIDINDCSLDYNFFLSYEDIRGLEQAANERDEELLKNQQRISSVPHSIFLRHSDTLGAIRKTLIQTRKPRSGCYLTVSGATICKPTQAN